MKRLMPYHSRSFFSLFLLSVIFVAYSFSYTVEAADLSSLQYVQHGGIIIVDGDIVTRPDLTTTFSTWGFSFEWPTALHYTENFLGIFRGTFGDIYGGALDSSFNYGRFAKSWSSGTNFWDKSLSIPPLGDRTTPSGVYTALIAEKTSTSTLEDTAEWFASGGVAGVEPINYSTLSFTYLAEDNPIDFDGLASIWHGGRTILPGDTVLSDEITIDRNLWQFNFNWPNAVQNQRALFLVMRGTLGNLDGGAPVWGENYYSQFQAHGAGTQSIGKEFGISTLAQASTTSATYTAIMAELDPKYIDGFDISEVLQWFFTDGAVGVPPVRYSTLSFEFNPITEDCCSSVAFLPGLQASRLYKQQVFENTLWEPNINADIEKLYLNSQGVSIDSSIYTDDIIDEALGFNVYLKFSESMDALVNDGTLNEWLPLPYDWRMDLNDILDNDVKLRGGNTYNILDSVEDLAGRSPTGKITIIAHSNGGLLGKLLISRLEAEGKAGLVDKFIMVGTPQLGTPKAIMSLLHGGERGVLKGWLPNHEVTRGLGENMPSAYNLLPSASYFSVVDTSSQPIIEFDASTGVTSYLRSVYGNTISTFANLTNFLSGESGVRSEPAPDDVDEPNVLNETFLNGASNLHSNTLDVWAPPTNVEVVQIAGWGLDTFRGIKYVEQTKQVCNEDFSVCTNQQFLDPRPLLTQDGDKTVVIPSAVAMGGTKYYLNLPKNNIRLVRNRDHADILEAEPVRALLEGIITENTDVLPEHITATKPPIEGSSMRLAMHSPVEVHIYDSFGNHTGVVPNPDPASDLVLIEEQIPNSYYFEFGEGKYFGISTGEEYRIEFHGEDFGTFTFEIEEVLGDEVLHTISYTDIPVSALTVGGLTIQNLNTVPELTLDIDGDGASDVTLSGGEGDVGVSFEILRSIIEGMDMHRGLKKELIEKLKKAQRELAKAKMDKVVKKLEDFIKKLEKEIKKNLKKETKKKHKQKISTEDAQQLIKVVTQLEEGVI